MSESALLESQLFCRNLTRNCGSNFVRTFCLLPPYKREAMEILYAFMRTTDDLADSSEPIESRKKHVLAWLNEVHNAFDMFGKYQADPSIFTAQGRLVLPAMMETARQFHIPSCWLEAVIRGTLDDLVLPVRKNTLDESILYCDAVAGAVGMATLAIFGTSKSIDSPEIFNGAMACGRALQWTNYLRDLGEDIHANRCYFPMNELTEFGLSVEMLDSLRTVPEHERKWLCLQSPLRDFFERQFARTEQFYQESQPLASWISPDSRRVYRAMIRVYHSLFERIQKEPQAVFSRRIHLSSLKKFYILLKTFFSSKK